MPIFGRIVWFPYVVVENVCVILCGCVKGLEAASVLSACVTERWAHVCFMLSSSHDAVRHCFMSLTFSLVESLVTSYFLWL